MGVQFANRCFGISSLDMDHPDVGANGLDSVGDAGMLASVSIDLRAQIAQGRRQLPDVYVHAPGFSLAGSSQWTRMEGDECRPVHAQLFVTTI